MHTPKLFWTRFLSVILAAVPVELAAPKAGMDNKQTVTIAYFADLHAQLEEHHELFWRGGKEDMDMAGGVARIAAAAGELRAARPDGFIFLDAGDTIQGSAAAAWTEGRAIVPAVNALGLDAGIPGNWEVVYNAAALKQRAAELKYPLLAANVFDRASGSRLFRPYAVEERNGIRIAIVGYTDPDVPLRQPPGFSAGLAYLGADILQDVIDQVRRDEAPHAVVLATHVGLPQAVRLAETLSGIDVVLSSDTHERTYAPIVRGNTWVVEPGSFGSFLGRLDLTFENGKLADRRWELIELRRGRYGEDARVKEIVALSLAPHRERMERVIGSAGETLMRYAVAETTLDPILADAIREAAGTEIGLSNGFRFAYPLPAGPLREADLWTIFPIVTRLKTGRVTGRQLREFWESELESVYSSNPERLFGGWLPRPSGMTLRFDADAPAGQRVREIRVGGESLDDGRWYTIAACEREGERDDTLCRIPEVKDPRVLDVDGHEAVRRYLAGHSPVGAPQPGRVVAQDRPPVERSQFAR